MSSVLKVGMADLNVVKAPLRLRTIGLGSCVGVVLYDSVVKIAGMAHIMLPSSELGKGEIKREKYADTAIPMLIEEMERLGAVRRRMVAKLAGGAQMFALSTGGEAMRIGPRNVEACKRILTEYGITIQAEDTGGNFGRTIEVDAETGILQIKTVNQGVKEV